MRVIIAGSRTVADYVTVVKAVADSGFDVTEVVSGTAAGADRLGERWAQERSIPIKKFPAQWSLYGRRAGPIRNRMMAEYADALVAVWDGASRGTKNMIDEARRRSLRVFVAEEASHVQGG